MNLNKHREFFDPDSDLKFPIHIIGVGAVGSSMVEQLIRLGISQIHIYDFDKVEPHNITNQIYFNNQIGQPKEKAITDIAKMINPNVDVIAHGRYTDQPLAGYIFLCIDDIDLRRTICQENYYNNSIKAIFDIRMRLIDSQGYTANWSKKNEKDNLIKTMNFSHSEAKNTTPISACGTTLNVTPTVRLITSYQIANWINLVKGKDYKRVLLVESFDYSITTF